MHQHNPANERVKRRYFAYLKEAKRYSEPSVDAVAKAICRFEAFTRYKEFKLFHTDAAVAFKRHLAQQIGQRSGDVLSKSTLHSTLSALRNFFFWLAGQQGFRSRISYSDAEYFNLSEKDATIAKARRERPSPTIAQIQSVLNVMPAATVIDRRDRAIVALTLLTGARVGAMASLRLKHISTSDRCIFQDARDVRTKFSKTFSTWFFPVPAECFEIIVQWVGELTEQMLWGTEDPLFPATRIEQGPDALFHAGGLGRTGWSGGGPIRDIFRKAFATAGLPYFHPHTFRTTLALLGEQVCRTPEEMKAWSQNLGHEKVQTTFSSYGQVPARRQAELIKGMIARPIANTKLLEAAARFLGEFQNVSASDGGKLNGCA